MTANPMMNNTARIMGTMMTQTSTVPSPGWLTSVMARN